MPEWQTIDNIQLCMWEYEKITRHLNLNIVSVIWYRFLGLFSFCLLFYCQNLEWSLVKHLNISITLPEISFWIPDLQNQYLIYELTWFLFLAVKLPKLHCFYLDSWFYYSNLLFAFFLFKQFFMSHVLYDMPAHFLC